MTPAEDGHGEALNAPAARCRRRRRRRRRGLLGVGRSIERYSSRRQQAGCCQASLETAMGVPRTDRGPVGTSEPSGFVGGMRRDFFCLGGNQWQTGLITHGCAAHPSSITRIIQAPGGEDVGGSSARFGS
jgi:hypothetical protein